MIRNETIAKMVIFQQRELDVYSPGYEKPKSFSAIREPVEGCGGRLVFRTFDRYVDQTEVIPSIDLYLDGTMFGTAKFAAPVHVCRGDSLHVTYRLEWWGRDGDDEPWWRPGPPGNGRKVRPASLVPPLSAWDKIQIGLSVGA